MEGDGVGGVLLTASCKAMKRRVRVQAKMRNQVGNWETRSARVPLLAAKAMMESRVERIMVKEMGG